MTTRESLDIEQSNLCTELQVWCKQQNLPHQSADELIFIEDLTPEQRQWLTDFCARWDDWDQRDLAAYAAERNDESNVRYDYETGERIQYEDAADASEHHLRMMGG